MAFAMEPAVVGVSAATQSGLAAEMGGAAGAVAPASECALSTKT